MMQVVVGCFPFLGTHTGKGQPFRAMECGGVGQCPPWPLSKMRWAIGGLTPQRIVQKVCRERSFSAPNPLLAASSRSLFTCKQ
jgi:hypothetical protein